MNELKDIVVAPVPSPAAEQPYDYIWEGVVGNSSRIPYGLQCWSGFEGISKIVLQPLNVTPRFGFAMIHNNEGRWPLFKFAVDDPTVVLANFGPKIGKYEDSANATPVDIAITGNFLHVKNRDGSLNCYDIHELRLASSISFPVNPQIVATPEELGIHFIPQCYCSTVCINAPHRVFAGWKEYHVGYAPNVPWSFVRDWNPHDPEFGNRESPGFFEGLRSVVTVGNSTLGTRTLGICHDSKKGNFARLVEMKPDGSLVTLVRDLPAQVRLNKDGLWLKTEPFGDHMVQFLKQNFETGEKALVGWAEHADTNPVWFIRETESGKIIEFDPAKTWPHNHLAGLSKIIGTTQFKWDWEALPTGKNPGRWDPDAWFAGEDVMHAVTGEHILIAYRGEGWKDGGTGQANQIFHYLSDGKYQGQLGVPMIHGVAQNASGSASNLLSLDAITVGGKIYIYTNDESGRGVHRWRIEKR